MKTITADKIIDFLEEKKIDASFDGLGICLRESLQEYKAIFSSELELLIYVNVFGNFDVLTKYNENDIYEHYKGYFELIGAYETQVFLDSNYVGTVTFYKNNIPLLIHDFNMYFGIEEGLMASKCYSDGLDTMDEIKALINKQIKKNY